MAVVVDRQNGRVSMDTVAEEAVGPFVPAFYRLVGVVEEGSAEVQNLTGKTLAKLNCGVGGSDMVPAIGRRSVNGFKLAAITSGRVEILLW